MFDFKRNIQTMSKAKALTKSQIKHVLAICELMTHSESKRCALVLSHAAMRVTEIALLQTKSILYPSGKIREEIYLPASICKGLRPRTIWLTNKLSREIVQEWINFRIKKRWGTVINGAEYQGLIPESRFLYSNRGRPYALTKKDRLMMDGSIKTYWASDALEHIIRQIYKKAGLHQASSHSGRKSLATNAIHNGRKLEDVARILGHKDPETTLHYIDFSDEYIVRMYTDAL